jgi:hypothetical protein
MTLRYRTLVQAAALVAIALVTRHSGADAPPGRYTISAGTVIDTKTGLTWQQGVGPGANWANAKTYCAGLSLAGTGWRLPTMKELLTILDVLRSGAPYIDQTAFPGPAAAFWSSTPYAPSSGNAWIVYTTALSSANYFLSVSSSTTVRCVR